MPPQRPPRYVDPLAPRGRAYRVFASLASSRVAMWLSSKAIWSAVSALLQTRGARTGRLRRNAVIYFHDGELVTIVASQAGRPGNPAWFYNARANPDVLLGGLPFRAEIVEDEAARARLWALADRVFPAFATYRERAAAHGRTVPILQLTPR